MAQDKAAILPASDEVAGVAVHSQNRTGDLCPRLAQEETPGARIARAPGLLSQAPHLPTPCNFGSIGRAGRGGHEAATAASQRPGIRPVVTINAMKLVSHEDSFERGIEIVELQH